MPQEATERWDAKQVLAKSLCRELECPQPRLRILPWPALLACTFLSALHLFALNTVAISL
jgi:hypothetical protein